MFIPLYVVLKFFMLFCLHASTLTKAMSTLYGIAMWKKYTRNVNHISKLNTRHEINGFIV